MTSLVKYVISGLMVLTAAADVSAQAEPSRPWSVRFDAGAAEIHRFVPDPRGLVGGVRVVRAWRSDAVRLDFGVYRSGADQGFLLIDVGAEVRLCSARCRVAPFVGGFYGSLVEWFSGTRSHTRATRVGGGIEVKVDQRQSVRAALFSGRHSRSARGPHILTLGYAWRF